ncbi:MAG: poly-beta-1,6-N-acetyl-D-glucosamine biosynthesis protein PgaD [Thermodesulfobacteriota bacterium]
MPDIYIVDKPELKSKGRKLSEMSVTTFIWVLWLWLLLPIINIILWTVGIQTFYRTLIVETGYLDFFSLIRRMGLTVVLVFVIMRAWGYYNYWRFGKRNKNKRRNLPPATPGMISEIFRLSPGDIVKIQESKEVTFSFNEDGPVIYKAE